MPRERYTGGEYFSPPEKEKPEEEPQEAIPLKEAVTQVQKIIQEIEEAVGEVPEETKQIITEAADDITKGKAEITQTVKEHGKDKKWLKQAVKYIGGSFSLLGAGVATLMGMGVILKESGKDLTPEQINEIARQSREGAAVQKMEGGRAIEGRLEMKELTPEQKTEQITKELNNRFSFNSKEMETDLLQYEKGELEQALARAKEDLTQVDYNDLMLLLRDASTFRAFPWGSATPGSTTFRPKIAEELNQRAEACRVYQAAIVKNFCAAKAGQPGEMNNVEFLKGQWWNIVREGAEAIRAVKINERGERAIVQEGTTWGESYLIRHMTNRNIFQDDSLWSGLSLEEKKILVEELKPLADSYAGSAHFGPEGIEADFSALIDEIEASISK